MGEGPGEVTAEFLGRAEAEARALGHPYVGSEHLLLALAGGGASGDPLLARLLRDPARVRAAVLDVLERGTGSPPSGPLPATARLCRALSGAREEAADLGADRIGPGHLLLALLRDTEGLAGRTLRSLGVLRSAARDVLCAEAAAQDGEPEAAGAFEGPVRARPPPLAEADASVARLDADLADLRREAERAVRRGDRDRAEALLRHERLLLGARRALRSVDGGSATEHALRRHLQRARWAIASAEALVDRLATGPVPAGPGGAGEATPPAPRSLQALVDALVREPGSLARVLDALGIPETRFLEALRREVERRSEPDLSDPCP